MIFSLFYYRRVRSQSRLHDASLSGGKKDHTVLVGTRERKRPLKSAMSLIRGHPKSFVSPNCSTIVVFEVAMCVSNPDFFLYASLTELHSYQQPRQVQVSHA